MKNNIRIIILQYFSNMSVVLCQLSKRKQNLVLSVAIMSSLCYVRRISIRFHQEMTGVIQVKRSILYFHISYCTFLEFLDGNYLNSRRNDLLTDDRLRVYVRVILVDEKETTTSDMFSSSHHYHHHHHHHHHHHTSPILPPPLPPHSTPAQQPPLPSPQQQQASAIPKTQASTSSSSASSSTTTPTITNSNISNTSTTSLPVISGLFSDEKERFKSLELLSSQIKVLLDDERFTDVRIHVMPKQEQEPQKQQQSTNDDHRKSNRLKRTISKQHPSCSSCHCTPEKAKPSPTNNERLFDHQHEQSSSGKTNLS